ncbi:MAG: SDR family oxidoreductase [Nitrososphaerales archaeon]|nr:SDR family oxidoreductase [Nitrososphaerales archaeon]
MPVAEKMKGKVCVVTGGNSGIGKVTALELARMGANVVMVSRDPRKGERARAELVRDSGNSAVELMIADLSLQREVRRLASDLKRAHTKIHVLVNNAGSNFVGYSETEEGVERTMAVNYFAPFLLTNLLVDVLVASAPSRVVNVASVAHHGSALDLDDMNGRKSQGTFGLRAYGRSKLALVLFTYELARRLQGKGVTVNCLHPGAVRTNIWSHSGVASPLARIVSLFMRGPEKGAETCVYLASAPEVEGLTGKYFIDLKERHSSRASYDEELAARLWDLSVKMTSLNATRQVHSPLIRGEIVARVSA